MPDRQRLERRHAVIAKPDLWPNPPAKPDAKGKMHVEVDEFASIHQWVIGVEKCEPDGDRRNR